MIVLFNVTERLHMENKGPKPLNNLKNPFLKLFELLCSVLGTNLDPRSIPGLEKYHRENNEEWIIMDLKHHILGPHPIFGSYMFIIQVHCKLCFFFLAVCPGFCIFWIVNKINNFHLLGTISTNRSCEHVNYCFVIIRMCLEPIKLCVFNQRSCSSVSAYF
jgi:hypothetical protein